MTEISDCGNNLTHGWFRDTHRRFRRPATDRCWNTPAIMRDPVAGLQVKLRDKELVHPGRADSQRSAVKDHGITSCRGTQNVGVKYVTLRTESQQVHRLAVCKN